MEELEDLKQIWKSHKQDYEPKKESEIARMLQGKSNSIITKLKRNIWIELILMIAGSIALGIYGVTLESGATMWLIISMITLFIGYSFYYVKKLKLLNTFISSDENLKTNLQYLYKRLSTYLNFYKKSFIIIYPLYFFLGLLFAFLDLGMDNLLVKLQNPIILLTLMFIAGFFVLHVTTITNLYLNKLYGKYIDKIQELLRELQDGHFSSKE